MARALRVLLVTDWMSGRGGSETYANAVRAGLSAVGDEVRLLTSRTGSVGDGTAAFVAYATEQLALQAVLQVANPFAFAQARAAVRTFRPDVALVHLFAYHLSPAVLWPLREVPTAMMIVDYKIVCPLGSKMLPDGRLCSDPAGFVCWRSGCLTLPHWLRDQVRYAAINAAVRRTTRVLACSRHVQRVLGDSGIKSEHVPLPVEAPGSSFVRRPAEDPEFVYCGRLTVEKGVAILVRAFARLHTRIPRARLKVVGDGPLRSQIESLAAAHGVAQAVTVTGWLEPASVERELEGTWALVAPAQWAEPFGLVAPEAIVRGVPVIASRTGGFSETVEEALSGLLVPNSDEDALLAALERVARGDVFPSHTLAPDVVARARRRFDVGTHVTKLRRILRSLARRDDT